MRAGSDLTTMTADQLKHILLEGVSDFSAEICQEATIEDLDSAALSRFKEMWQKKSGNNNLVHFSNVEILVNSELVIEGGVTYAALILLGKKSALNKHISQAEVIHEYRSTEASLSFQ